MTKEEFLNEFFVEKELNEFLESDSFEMWFYVLDDAYTTLAVCHFFIDPLDGSLVFEEFPVRGLDTVEKWRELASENGFSLSTGGETWPPVGLNDFLDHLNGKFRWTPPPMYTSDWTPDVSSGFDLE